MKFDVLTTVSVNLQVFWDKTLCQWWSTALAFRRYYDASKCQKLLTQWHSITSQNNWTSF